MKVEGSQSEMDLHGFAIWNAPCDGIEVKSAFEVAEASFNMIAPALFGLEVSLFLLAFFFRVIGRTAEPSKAMINVLFF